tara:strand:+ start:4111 stop:4491 length:381 start_codon:yes stop_codon:yes gene_type:complete
MSITPQKLQEEVKAAFEKGLTNVPGVDGLALWNEHVKSADLGTEADSPIGKWKKPTDPEAEFVKTADETAEDDPKWEPRHFESQPARIRLKKPCTRRRLAQIWFNLGSAGEKFEDHPLERYVEEFF